MKIVDIGVKVFTYKSNQVHDSEGHSHPGPEPRYPPGIGDDHRR